MEDCIFCRIANKQLPANVVYENEKVMAFKDIYPVRPFHVLIIPKQHIENVNSINKANADVLADIHLAAVEIAKEHKLNDTGFRLITNCGKDAGQTVMHFHYHMLGGAVLGTSII